MNVTAKDIAQLDRLTACVAFVFNVRYESLRGFDVGNKVVASLLARELLYVSDGAISSYYRLGVAQMKDKWQDVKIQLELDDALFKNYNTVHQLWKLNEYDPVENG